VILWSFAQSYGLAGDFVQNDKCDAHEKAARFMEIVRLLIGDISGRAGLIDNDVINHS
jgi:hypothetical protein